MADTYGISHFVLYGEIILFSGVKMFYVCIEKSLSFIIEIFFYSVLYSEYQKCYTVYNVGCVDTL